MLPIEKVCLAHQGRNNLIKAKNKEQEETLDGYKKQIKSLMKRIDTLIELGNKLRVCGFMGDNVFIFGNPQKFNSLYANRADSNLGFMPVQASENEITAIGYLSHEKGDYEIYFGPNNIALSNRSIMNYQVALSVDKLVEFNISNIEATMKNFTRDFERFEAHVFELVDELYSNYKDWV